MKQGEYLNVRLSQELKQALERERQRMSRTAGAEVKTSAVVRAVLEKQLVKKSRAA